ncbi:hypothetical protein IGS73_17485 [Janibacter indicus]|uniref:Uncharacterized protein n=1 Tax=Janibacter indicus TaxID=857417 RepID=A0A7L9J093_9MICO|nr:hypothetical protein [Janibacter indicus]QOK22799.1 hypothetical protein IGS73_17485 [Janibacter indicus]
MGRFGREAMRRWKISSPAAFDALRDPAAYFNHIDAHSTALVEQLARGDLARHGGQRDLRFWIDQQSRSLLESMPHPPREHTFLDDIGDEAIDPRGRFLAGRMPQRPHELWTLLEDPTVPAILFQLELRAWYETLPRAPWIEQTNLPLPLFESENPGELVRVGGLRRPEIRQWPEATVVGIQRGSDLEDAFQVLADATTAERSWASGGYIDRSEGGLVLPPWRDDSSEPDADELALMVGDCGPLQRGTEYVVTAGRPRVVDFHAVSWNIGSPRRERRVRPWLLLDVDGVLLREGTATDHLSPKTLRQLDLLRQRYDFAWATSWEGSANTLLRGSGQEPWPVVRVVSAAGNDPDGYDSARVVPILAFVGDRPFAWVDDQIGRRDADALTHECDCLVVRPNPRRGLDDDHVDRLLAWAQS